MATIQGLCAKCGTETTNRCSGCQNALRYTTNPAEFNSKPDSHSTFFCSPGCQRAIWPSHKAECKTLQARKELLRAAELLQGIMLKIRRHATMVQFNDINVEKVNGVTKVVLQSAGHHPSDRRMLKEYPDLPKDMDEGLVKGLWLHCACLASKLYLFRFAKELLLSSELCTEVEEVNVLVRNSKLQIFSKLPSGQYIPPEPLHNLYRAKLRASGETWALDPTGAQFGYPSPLCAWPELVSDAGRGWKPRQVLGLGYVRQQIWDKYGPNPMRVLVMQRLEKMELCLDIEESIPVLAQLFAGDGGRLGGVLKKSDAAFTEIKPKFLDFVENFIRYGMRNSGMPDRMLEREKKINGVLSPGMADWTSAKSTEAYSTFVKKHLASRKDLPN